MHRFKFIFALTLGAFVLGASNARAQARVGHDSATRLTRFGRDIIYGTATGLAFAGVDQLNNNPAEWGRGWPGYEKRAASNIGEFYVQEVVTEGLAAAMNRPLDYTRCPCRGTGDRIARAIRGAVTDQMPDGSNPLAIPRIVGAYAGSSAQAAWRPATASSKWRVAVINGTTSLALGAVINLWHEFRR